MREIYIYRDGQNQGPYSLEQVHACIIIGTLTLDDYAWYEGIPDWIPLSSAIAQLQEQGPEVHELQSWRRKVATADQKAELRFLDIRVKRDLTQGAWQDLINNACGDPATKSNLEVFRLKRRKEKEFLEFLHTNSFKLGIMYPTVGQVRETIDFLQDNIPCWATETSANEFATLILSRYPELKGNWPSALEDNSVDWVDEPATDRQIAYLKGLGATFSDSITKAEASTLIDRCKNRASDAQKRRLTFYAIQFKPEVTKDEATEMIDCYIGEHPESEDAYQEWKITNHIA